MFSFKSSLYWSLSYLTLIGAASNTMASDALLPPLEGTEGKKVIPKGMLSNSTDISIAIPKGVGKPLHDSSLSPQPFSSEDKELRDRMINNMEGRHVTLKQDIPGRPLPLFTFLEVLPQTLSGEVLTI